MLNVGFGCVITSYSIHYTKLYDTNQVEEQPKPTFNTFIFNDLRTRPDWAVITSYSIHYTKLYDELVQEQFKIKNDFKVAEDTLQALSKRVIQIESFITEKVTEVKSNLSSSLEQLEERQKPQAADHQQRTMKNLNDLALMLSEA